MMAENYRFTEKAQTHSALGNLYRFYGILHSNSVVAFIVNTEKTHWKFWVISFVIQLIVYI